MNDLISRQAALDCFRAWIDPYGDVHTPDEMPEYRAIEALPAAEPERKKPDHGYMWICPECGLEVHSDFRRCVRCGWDRPSAERKKGEWIDYTEDGFVECPFCHSATNCDGNKDELRFCFSCGAELR